MAADAHRGMRDVESGLEREWHTTRSICTHGCEQVRTALLGFVAVSGRQLERLPCSLHDAEPFEGRGLQRPWLGKVERNHHHGGTPRVLVQGEPQQVAVLFVALQQPDAEASRHLCGRPRDPRQGSEAGPVSVAIRRTQNGREQSKAEPSSPSSVMLMCVYASASSPMACGTGVASSPFHLRKSVDLPTARSPARGADNASPAPLAGQRATGA